MVPSKLRVMGFDEQCVYLQTVEGQDVFVEWRALPIGQAQSLDAVRAAAKELGEIRRRATQKGLDAIEKALAVVTEAEERKTLHDAFESLAEPVPDEWTADLH